MVDILVACIDCGKERRVQKRKKIPNPIRCRICNNKYTGLIRRQKHSTSFDRYGYVRLRLAKDDFFFTMAEKNGYIKEHRLIMAKYLGRHLQPWEVIHHKNGVKTDNRIENLELTTNGEHLLTHTKGYEVGYQKGLLGGRNKQIKELKLQIKELMENKDKA